jgi:hypothetical protein
LRHGRQDTGAAGTHHLLQQILHEDRQMLRVLRNCLGVRHRGKILKSKGWNAKSHANPYVGVSRVRSWSRLFVLGAISWAFIAKYRQRL